MTTLAFARFQALRDIDRAAGDVRLKYITDIPGQQAVYIVKTREAEEYTAAYALDPFTPVPPYLSAEAAETGEPAITIAATVIALNNTWHGVQSPAIEAKRVAGKAAVMVADTVATVVAVRDAVIAELEAL